MILSCWTSGPWAPAENMAWDEVLLQHASALGQPLLRLYEWRESAATFGYFQKFQSVASLTRLRPLIRRPTGGGLVPHDGDWTYSLMFPAGHPWQALRARQSYHQLHEWLRQSFETCHIPTSLCPAPRPEGSGQCFVGAEEHDLLWQDRKIAGAAQRRSKYGLLIQGSIQPPSGLSRADWEASFRRTASRQWQWQWQPMNPDPALHRAMEQLVENKYGNPAYNQKR